MIVCVINIFVILDFDDSLRKGFLIKKIFTPIDLVPMKYRKYGYNPN